MFDLTLVKEVGVCGVSSMNYAIVYRSLSLHNVVPAYG